MNSCIRPIFCVLTWLSAIIHYQLLCRSDVDFHEFCLQVLFECISKDRPALLQVIFFVFLFFSFSGEILKGTIWLCKEIIFTLVFESVSLWFWCIKLAYQNYIYVFMDKCFSLSFKGLVHGSLIYQILPHLLLVSSLQTGLSVLVHNNWFNGWAGFQWYYHCPRLTLYL